MTAWIRTLHFLVLVALLSPGSIRAATGSASGLAFEIQASGDRKECVVYVTKTGAKYHRSSCSSLRKSRIPLARGEAIDRGYTACKRCGGSACE
jgi:hypothetical protein